MTRPQSKLKCGHDPSPNGEHPVNTDCEAVLAGERDKVFDLLREWMAWWMTSDVAPAKLPDGLHVRTVVTLVHHDPELMRLNPMIIRALGDADAD